MPGGLAVIILAAGKSTRFKSETTKALHRICGRTLFEWVCKAVAPLRPAQTLLVHGVHNLALADRYGSGCMGLSIATVLQDPPLGTAHALLQVESQLDGEIDRLLVLHGDAPLLETWMLLRLLEDRAEHRALHAILTATLPDPAQYGRVLRSSHDNRIDRIVEQADATPSERLVREINTGVYLFDRSVFDQVRQAMSLGPSEVKGEFYLPDVVRFGPTVGVMLNDPDFIPGIKHRAHLAHAEHVILRRLRTYWMYEGVSFVLPATTYLEADVELAEDVEIGPYCVLLGQTRIGKGTRLSAGCVLEGCTIGKDCTLMYVRGQFATLGDEVQAGPYVNLRPGTLLHNGVKVGNFVETKNSEVGPGSKLPHLQYIGDATIGPDCNIGAGTIFCNYDGFQKHRTKLGRGVFIGSNSSLQAPLTIGDGAYVAMGSSITRDVPAGALAVGRARQENKEGYADKLRAQKRAAVQEEGRTGNGSGGIKEDAHGPNGQGTAEPEEDDGGAA